MNDTPLINPVPARRRFLKPSTDLRQLSLLHALANRAEISQSELGRQAGLSGAMVNSYLKDLQNRGLVDFTPVNGKSYSYEVTTSGMEAERELFNHYCAEVVQAYAALKDQVRAKLEPLHENGVTRLVLWGASDTCEVALSALHDGPFNILALLDSDPAKQGRPFHGHVVSPPALLDSLDCQAVVITSFGRQEEIFNHLKPRARDKGPAIVRL
jgi:DNA-binding MarR family transcriptional regulator